MLQISGCVFPMTTSVFPPSRPPGGVWAPAGGLHTSDSSTSTRRPARTRSALSNVKITDSESTSPSSRRSHSSQPKYTIGRVGAGQEAQRSRDHTVGNNDFSQGKKNGMWCRMTFLALVGLFQAAHADTFG